MAMSPQWLSNAHSKKLTLGPDRADLLHSMQGLGLMLQERKIAWNFL